MFVIEILGGFAVVFVAQDVATGKNYALKVSIMHINIKAVTFKQRNCRDFYRQMKNLKTVSCKK